jgi:hypothetical protein
VPNDALVVTFGIETTTLGAIATAPAAPPSASLETLSSSVEASVMSLEPDSVAPLPVPVVVVSLTRLIATDAPIPTLPGSSVLSMLCWFPVAWVGSSVMMSDGVLDFASDCELSSS